MIITCEHAGNMVPGEYAGLFRCRTKLLSSHRGFDSGALALARLLSERLSVPLFFSEVTRLLVDLNRSPHNPRIFSEISAVLSDQDKKDILTRYYYPYRKKVESAVAMQHAAGRRVIHVSVHTFSPVRGLNVRTADVGLLYDPSRTAEKEFCMLLKRLIRDLAPALKVRCNYPYYGRSDGLTTSLRRRFGKGRYLGIELEVNQKYPCGMRREWKKVQEALGEAVSMIRME